MKYEQLKNCMDLTEDFSKKYYTKAGREISKDELPDAKDSYTDLELSGEDSHAMTIQLEKLINNSNIEKEAHTLALQAKANIQDAIVAKKYADEFERMYKIIIKTKTFLKATRTAPGVGSMKYSETEHLRLIYEKFPQFVDVFDAIKEKALKKGSDSASTIKQSTVKKENIFTDKITEYGKKLLGFLRKYIPHVDEMETLVDDALTDLKNFGTEFRRGVERMEEDPDYYMNED